jgi:cobalt-zinc-cadmium efflux system outer membrane protein
VQYGLDFVRNVRVAYTDLALATAQLQLSNESVELRQGIADLTQKRLERGEISELEANTAKIDAVNARALASTLSFNVPLASAKLAALMGLPKSTPPLSANSFSTVSLETVDSEALVNEAIAARPDMHAAEWAVSAAVKRAQLSRWIFWRVEAVVDANQKGAKGYEVGPGLRMDIPIFNRNQGGIKRAQGELLQAQYARDAVRDQVIQDVRTAATQFQQAQANLKILQREIVPALKETTEITERAYATGGTTYLMVLQTSSDYISARTRELDQMSAVHRALAELERSVGRRITGMSDTCNPELPEILPPNEIFPPVTSGKN